MPRILAIETSGKIASVAIAQGRILLSEHEFPHGLKHAAEIIPAIDLVCKAHDWKPMDIEHIYVSVGPGSFTGLRIGITLAKTMAMATGAKLVAVPSVQVLAQNAPDAATNLIIVLDAKREQIFTARFTKTNSQWNESEPAHLDSLVGMLNRSARPVHLLGEGIPYHQQHIPAEWADGIHCCEPLLWKARASEVVKLGLERAEAGQFILPDQLLPIYIRQAEAEEKWQKMHG